MDDLTSAPATSDLPRERLLAAGPRALSDAELIALVLGTGTARVSARAAALSLVVLPPTSEGPLSTGLTGDPGPVPEGCAHGLTLDTSSLMSNSPCVLSLTASLSEPAARPALAALP